MKSFPAKLSLAPLLLVIALFLVACSCAVYGQSEPDPGPGVDQMEAQSIRGNVTAVNGNTITVKTDERETYSVATGPNTRFRKQRDQITINGLRVGDMIAAVGDKNPANKTLGAVFVVVIDKEQYEKMRADFGKTWTTGVVQSIDGTNIVIKRPDNAKQTIAVDENTAFRRRREDITLPDIKMGDNVTARGGLQNGAFLATEVNVGRPRGFGAGRPGGWAGQRSEPNTTNPPQPPN